MYIHAFIFTLWRTCTYFDLHLFHLLIYLFSAQNGQMCQRAAKCANLLTFISIINFYSNGLNESQNNFISGLPELLVFKY